MKQQIKIEVFVPDKRNTGQFKTVFSYVIVIDDGCDFDYKSVLKGLRCIFTDSSFITFNILS